MSDPHLELEVRGSFDYLSIRWLSPNIVSGLRG